MKLLLHLHPSLSFGYHMTPIKKVYLSILILGILEISLVIFLISPFFKGVKESSEAFLSERSNMVRLSEEKESLKKIETFYKNYQMDLDKIESLLVNPDLPIEFINFLEENARVSPVNLEIVSLTKKTEKGDPWPSLSLQLSLSGFFSDFLRFLEKLEEGPYLIETLELNVGRPAKSEQEAKELKEIFLLIKVFTK